MASNRVAMDYEQVKGHMLAIQEATVGVQETIQKAATQIKEFNEGVPVPDMMVEAVHEKLVQIREALAPIPGQIQELDNTLKQQGESIGTTVDDSVRRISEA